MKKFIASAVMFAATTSLMAVVPAFAADNITVDENVAAPAQIAAAPEAAVHIDRAKFELSDSQREALAALRDKYTVDNATKKAEIQVLKHQLFAELGKPAVDRNAVLTIQAKINALHDSIANNKANAMVDASSIFTPEQRAAMHHHRFGFHHGHGGHGGPGGHGGHCGPGGC